MRPPARAMAAWLLAAAACGADVFPKPREFEPNGETFLLNGEVRILIPAAGAGEDEFLARSLAAELSERHGVDVRVERARALPAEGRFILMGAAGNPLVAAYGSKRGLKPAGAEGYALEATARAVVVAGSDAAGAFYGLQSLRQLIAGKSIAGVRARDWPLKPFRGIKLYLPGRENIGYFKRFVNDFAALYKVNVLIVEMNAGMRLDRHPELNAGWIELGKDLRYTRRERSPGPGLQFQDSSNADTADFGVLDKAEVAELVRYARERHIEVIPEIPSLTHSYYLLTRHRDLAEVQDAEWPDTYCPSEPRVYPLLFDVLDEYIEVMRPRRVHIGHDEWRMPLGVCRRCLGKDPTELFAADLNRIYGHLREKGVGTAMWGDHFIQPLRGDKVKDVPNRKGTPYTMPGALTPEQVKRLVPKDILQFNWFWDTRREEGLDSGLGEDNEAALEGWGFQQVFGNFRPDFADWDRRAARRGVLGGAPSSWAATTEFNFGKDMMREFLGCANLLWSTERFAEPALSRRVQELLPGIRRRLAAAPYPSDDGPVEPVAMAGSLDSAMPGLRGGEVRAGLQTAAGRAVGAGAPPAAVNADVSSLVFLHACSKASRHAAAYTAIWNFEDTAELVGWYEVTYEDGFTVSVPLRYGVNILEPRQPAGKSVAYYAEAVDCGEATLYAYEWINPRFGKAVREVRLRQAKPDNPVLLAALGAVRKRTPPAPKPLRTVGEPFRPGK